MKTSNGQNCDKPFVCVSICGEEVLMAPYSDVARLFGSADRLWRLTPGCQKIEKVAADSYRGWFRLGILGIAGSYAGLLKLQGWPSDDYRMTFNASRANGSGRIEASGKLRLLHSHHNRTTVRYAGRVQVSPPWSFLGAGAIKAFARLLLAQFFAAAEAELEAERSGRVARQGLLRNLYRCVRRSLR